MVEKQFVIVAYDISSDKRRLKIAKILRNYGVRANFSVFECFLTEKQITKMKNELSIQVSPVKDIILIYYLCKECIGKRTKISAKEEDDNVVKLL